MSVAVFSPEWFQNVALYSVVGVSEQRLAKSNGRIRNETIVVPKRNLEPQCGYSGGRTIDFFFAQLRFVEGQ